MSRSPTCTACRSPAPRARADPLTARTLLAPLLALLLLAGCGGPEPVAHPELGARTEQAAPLVTALADALASEDAEAAAALGDKDGAALLRALVANTEAAGLTVAGLRYIDEDPAASADLPTGQWAAVAELQWRFDAYDASAARTEVTVLFAQDDEELRIHGFGGGDRRLPVWLSGPVDVVRSPDALVLAEGPAGTAARYAEQVRVGVPSVRAVVGGDQRFVVEVPASGVDQALGAKAGEFASIAAVTTFTGAETGADAPVHVFINRDVFDALDPAGQQVVMTHELTHAATDAVHADAPLWLLEGYADHVALRDTELPVSVTAGQIIRRVRRQGVPEALPGPEQFDTQAHHLGAWYEAAWRAAEVLAAQGGEATLLALYRRTAAGEPVDAVLRSLYGFGEEELTRRWRQDLERIAG